MSSLLRSFRRNSSLDIVNSCTSHEPRGLVIIWKKAHRVELDSTTRTARRTETCKPLWLEQRVQLKSLYHITQRKLHQHWLLVAYGHSVTGKTATGSNFAAPFDSAAFHQHARKFAKAWKQEPGFASCSTTWHCECDRLALQQHKADDFLLRGRYFS